MEDKLLQKIHDLYKDYDYMPYISEKRDLEAWFKKLPVKKVPKQNMVKLENGLFPGDIIILWLINFGTFTYENHIPKYFEYTYGINAKERLDLLINQGYVIVESAFQSLDHVNSDFLKAILKEKQIIGVSKMNRLEVDLAIKKYLTEEELGQYFSNRGLRLSDTDKIALEMGQFVVDKHPKKKF